jgi:hypothetical protein
LRGEERAREVRIGGEVREGERRGGENRREEREKKEKNILSKENRMLPLDYIYRCYFSNYLKLCVQLFEIRKLIRIGEIYFILPYRDFLHYNLKGTEKEKERRKLGEQSKKM